CLSFMRYCRSTYKPLHRMSPKLREKSRPYSQSFGPTTDTTYNRPAGFTQPGHPTVAPLPPLLSPGICTDRGADSIPDGHSGYKRCLRTRKLVACASRELRVKGFRLAGSVFGDLRKMLPDIFNI